MFNLNKSIMYYEDDDDYDEYGDWCGFNDWDIGQVAELDGRKGKVCGYSTEGENISVRWDDKKKPLESTFWQGSPEFGRLELSWS